jgi:high-affinity iron transporter
VRRAVSIGAVAAFLLAIAPAPAGAAGGWQAATDARLGLSNAQSSLVFGDRAAARAEVDSATRAAESYLRGHPSELREARTALARAEAAVARGDDAALAAARATVWTALLRAAFDGAVSATSRGDASAARSWLLVREFRPPTRFSRPGADATLALDALAAGALSPAKAAAAVRTDLLDTTDGRTRSALDSISEAQALGFAVRRAEAGALALGYWDILAPAYRAQRGAAAERRAAKALASLAAATSSGRGVSGALATAERALEGFRAAPLAPAELLRRAGQLQRFVKLVPIEYGRGVRDGKVVADFEIQEAITFRDGAAGAFRDLEPVLLRRNAPATRRLGKRLEELGANLSAASHGAAVAPADDVEATADEALSLVEAVFPSAWKDAAKTADFDVISATLDRIEAAAASGQWGRAEQARLEAYGVFELGPEQRLRGLAPSLFQEIEGYFWYGAEGQAGLVQLVKSKATPEELAATRAALDDALAEAEQRIGSGPQSRLAIVTNSAIIVFREGLEAVLILAALMASMTGAQRRFRRPLLVGVGAALVASAATWVVAQTVLGTLAGFGERLEAIVSLVAIAVLLLILNWFYHRVYWQENLQGLHRRKKTILTGAGLSLAAAQIVGLAMLGFSSVYREGFETVLFLEALTLEAGAWTVAEGVALGLVGVLGVFFLVIALERKLPHKKMLIATGILITWVLVVMVGTTVQTLQKVGWVAVTPIQGLELPYWAGLWLGLYPTWQGIIAQAGALVFVVGSYFAAELIRSRRRAVILAAPVARPRSAPVEQAAAGRR